MGGFGDLMMKAIIIQLIIFAVLCIAFGGLLVWGIPKLWAWLLPIIHVWTA